MSNAALMLGLDSKFRRFASYSLAKSRELLGRGFIGSQIDTIRRGVLKTRFKIGLSDREINRNLGIINSASNKFGQLQVIDRGIVRSDLYQRAVGVRPKRFKSIVEFDAIDKFGVPSKKRVTLFHDRELKAETIFKQTEELSGGVDGSDPQDLINPVLVEGYLFRKLVI